MNGRIYSPKLGRMLSPDPVTQAPENGQNYDRYTYAFNNPMKYMDPTGYSNELGGGFTGLFPDSQLIQHTYSWDDFHLDHNDPAQVLIWALHSGALGPDSSAYQIVQANQGISVGGAASGGDVASGGGAASNGGSLSLGAPPGFEDYSVPAPVFEEPPLPPPPAPPVPVNTGGDDIGESGDLRGGRVATGSTVNVYDPYNDPEYVRLFVNASLGRMPVAGYTVPGDAANQAIIGGGLIIGAAAIGAATIQVCIASGASLCAAHALEGVAFTGFWNVATGRPVQDGLARGAATNILLGPVGAYLGRGVPPYRSGTSLAWWLRLNGLQTAVGEMAVQ